MNSAPPRDLKILIVDDDPALRRLLRALLERQNYSVAGEAQSGKEAVTAAGRLNPHIVLMDVIMETGDAGIRAARKITSKYQIPIIFITTSNNEDIIARALKTNPYGYVVKPVRPENLITAIEVTRVRHEYEQQLVTYQRSLEKSEALFRSIFQTIQSGYFQLTIDYRFSLVNPYLYDLLGYTSQRELLGKSIFEAGFSDTRQKNLFNQRLLEKGSIDLSEWRWKTRDRQFKTVLISVRPQPVQAEASSPQYEGSVHDITRFKELEADLRQAQKMEVINTLSSRLAHEISNQLTSILGYTDLCLLKLAQEDKLHRYLRAIQKKALESTEVTRQLLNISRKSSSEPQRIEMDEFLRERIQLIEKVMGSRVTVKSDLQTGGVHISADPRILEQVLFNLVINARDAMPEGGNFTLRTCLTNSSRRKGGQSPGEQASLLRVTLQDTGMGIGRQNLEKIFEPFYTTKTESVGTGLGLAIVRGSVIDLGGRIQVTSRPGRGTTFTIYLPPDQNAAGAADW